MVRQERKTAAAWPGKAVVISLTLLALFFLLPLLMLPGEGERREDPPRPTATLPTLDPPQASACPVAAVAPVPGADAAQTVRLRRSDGSVEELGLDDYLWGVAAAEMPASFHSEALKAQVVCARTYWLHQRQNAPDKHPDADVCTDFTCCQAYLTREQAFQSWGGQARRYADKITAAVRDTDGLLCLYGGVPIDAVFFSSSAGRTSAAAEVWGADVPYLTAVDSPEGEEVPGWRTVVSFSPEELVARFTASCPQADFSGAVETWIQDLTTDSSGAVKTVSIGGVEVTGAQARAVLGLRSAHFTVQAAGTGFTFQVTGYGHGVGLSQYGANALAGEGKSFQEILEWYYTGVTVGPCS